MSHIGRRIPGPEPPCKVMAEELRDVWQIVQLLSTRLAAIERHLGIERPPPPPEDAP